MLQKARSLDHHHPGQLLMRFLSRKGRGRREPRHHRRQLTITRRTIARSSGCITRFEQCARTTGSPLVLLASSSSSPTEVSDARMSDRRPLAANTDSPNVLAGSSSSSSRAPGVAELRCGCSPRPPRPRASVRWRNSRSNQQVVVGRGERFLRPPRPGDPDAPSLVTAESRVARGVGNVLRVHDHLLIDLEFRQRTDARGRGVAASSRSAAPRRQVRGMNSKSFPASTFGESVLAPGRPSVHSFGASLTSVGELRGARE